MTASHSPAILELMEKLYLSQRNITTLLQKLDRVRNGETSPCTLIKNDTGHPVYPQTLRRVAVTAVEDGDQYFPGVSPRLRVTRATLLSLLTRLEERSALPITRAW